MGRRLIAPVVLVCGLGAAGCGSSQPAAAVPPEPLPLPTAGIAGHRVTVYPVTLVASEGSPAWVTAARPREEALRRADSVIATFLIERAPEVTWVLPDELRAAARRAPGMLANPDQMGTALLRHPAIMTVPDPLRAQMRTLTGVAGDRFTVVPASLLLVGTPDGSGRAELSVVMTDVRTGLVGFRTVARGVGPDPWSALWEAMKTLVPDLP